MVLWTCHDMLCFMLRSRSECFTEGRSPSIVCSWCVVGQVLLPTRTARYAGLWAVPSPMSGHSRSRSQRVLAAVLKMASALRPPSPDTKKAFHIRDNPLAVGAQGRFFPVCGADLRCVNACSSIGRWLKDFELRYGTRHKWTCWLWGKPQGSPTFGWGRGWPMFEVLKRPEGKDLHWSVFFPTPLQMVKNLSGRLSRVTDDFAM